MKTEFEFTEKRFCDPRALGHYLFNYFRCVIYWVRCEKYRRVSENCKIVVLSEYYIEELIPYSRNQRPGTFVECTIFGFFHIMKHSSIKFIVQFNCPIHNMPVFLITISTCDPHYANCGSFWPGVHDAVYVWANLARVLGYILAAGAVTPRFEWTKVCAVCVGQFCACIGLFFGGRSGNPEVWMNKRHGLCGPILARYFYSA